MDSQDRELILGPAARLRQAPAVPEAADLVARCVGGQPAAVSLPAHHDLAGPDGRPVVTRVPR